MNQISKILKVNTKEIIKSYLISVAIALLGAIALAFAVKDQMADFGSAYKFSAALLVIIVTSVLAFISVVNSIEKIFPMASKLGFTRSKISKSLIIKDIGLLLGSSLIIFGLTHLFINQMETMPKIGSDIAAFFTDGKSSFLSIFVEVLIGINIGILASSVSYLIGFPVGPFAIILYVIFSSIVRERVINFNLTSIFTNGIVFILVIIFRHFVISKFDPKNKR